MAATDRKESVYELIGSMSKAEKRNFKLYAGRLSGNERAKFIALFDAMDSMNEYDEDRLLERCPVTKGQLPNMKAHLYRQILVSLRLLGVKHSETLELKEQIDHARILFDKGLYCQAGKMLDKAAGQAARLEQFPAALEIIELRRQIETVTVSSGLTAAAEQLSREAKGICAAIDGTGAISDMVTRLYSLHQTLGYARSRKDLDLLNGWFKPRLTAFASRPMSFTERFYYYQAMVWFRQIRHEFALSYRHSLGWLELFESRPEMKTAMYDSYLRGYSMILEGIFLMRRYDLLCSMLERFERESRTVGSINENAAMISQHIIFTGRLNKSILEGSFKDAIWLTRQIDGYLEKYSKYLTVPERMALHYKIACIYFGDGNYAKCMEYLTSVTGVRDPRVRRDLQCYGRMLNLIASYESGSDYNLDYQIKSVFTFLVKMNDMNEIKKELLAFLRKLASAGSEGVRKELDILYERLKPYENHPYERRTFYYLDIISWLESKITGRTVGRIIRERFEREQAAPGRKQSVQTV